MKTFAVIAALSGAFVSFAGAESTPANGNHPASNSPPLQAVAPVAENSWKMASAALEKRIQPVLAGLKRGDTVKEARVRGVLGIYFQAS